ncbi:MAG TPA: 4Fe-4S binding protein [Candidatus Sulfotelmatobacter sp.]|nr:4Fe-4S binding protein [Candidatus Sulfotelmatobacter sp.]
MAEEVTANGGEVGKPSLLGALSWRIESFFARYRGFIWMVHGAMFLVFLAVMVIPLLLPDPPPGASVFNNFTVLANYVLWGLWFPLLFLSVIVTGRSWCGLFCPMGAASEWMNRIGFQRAIPAWLRWEGTPLVSFVVTTILGQTLGVRDHPEAAAGLFGTTMLFAMMVGLLYGRHKRAWCRHMCPIGRVLGLYSRLGMVLFAPKHRVPGGDIYTEKGICPTMIELSHKKESRHCIECFRCVRTAGEGGVRMHLRHPGAEIEQIRDNRANMAEVWFLFMDTGVALGAFLWLVLPQYQDLRQDLGEWAIANDVAWLTQSGPAWLMSVHPSRHEVFLWADFLLILSFMLGCMALLSLLLAGFTALSAKFAGMVGADAGFRQRFVELGYQYAPIAMGSLVIGLGALLFDPIRFTPLGMAGVHALKGLLFLAALVWSVWLGERILARQGVATRRRWLPLLPGLAGSVAVGLAWWPAIFGL